MLLKLTVRLVGLATLCLVLLVTNAYAFELLPCPNNSCLQASADCEAWCEQHDKIFYSVICQDNDCPGTASCCYECFCLNPD